MKIRKRFGRQILCALCALSLAFGLVPVAALSAFAAEDASADHPAEIAEPVDQGSQPAIVDGSSEEDAAGDVVDSVDVAGDEVDLAVDGVDDSLEADGGIEAAGIFNESSAVDKPTVANLVYNGSKQSGVMGGEGYSLDGVVSATFEGTYQAVATLVDGYVWSDGTSDPEVLTWSISPRPLSDQTVKKSLSFTTCAYTGKVRCPVEKLTYKGVKLVKGVDYKVTLPAGRKNIGTYKITITGMGHFTGKVTLSYSIKGLYAPKPKAAANGLGKIKVSWNKITNASGYYVYRSASKNGTYKKIATVKGGSTLSYSNANLIKGKTYYYKVRAYGSGYTSPYSSITSAKATLKAPVMKGTATSSSSSTVKISWNKVTGASGYYVYARTSTSKAWTKIGTVKKGSICSFTYKKAGGAKFYSIIAYGKSGSKTYCSPRSNSIKVRALAKTSKVSRTSYGDDFDVKVGWNGVTGATGYQVYYKVGSSGSWKWAATVDGAKRSYIKHVTHGKWYYFKVRPVYKSSTGTTYGPFREASAGAYMISYWPNYYTIMTSSTKYSTTAIAMAVENNGSCTMRVYAKDAKLIDYDSTYYDRKLDLRKASGSYPKVNYIDIAPGKTETLLFTVSNDDPTWYDWNSRIRFKFRYDGCYYLNFSSNHYGAHYYEL